MFSDKRCEIKCVFPNVVGIRIMSIHIFCDMYLRLGLHVQIRLYYVLPYKAKISAQHGIGFIFGRCIVYLGLTMPNLQKKPPLIFEIFNIKKYTLFFFGTEYIFHYKVLFIQSYSWKWLSHIFFFKKVGLSLILPLLIEYIPDQEILVDLSNFFKNIYVTHTQKRVIQSSGSFRVCVQNHNDSVSLTFSFTTVEIISVYHIVGWEQCCCKCLYLV